MAQTRKKSEKKAGQKAEKKAEQKRTRSLYERVKAPFLELEGELGRDEVRLLRNAKCFFAFCMLLIAAVLAYYSRTSEEFVPLTVLGITAAVFWAHSDKTGRILMAAAGSIGFIHEVVGGMEGWFVYQSGVVFQTPLWLIPGYAAIFWACYNLWKQGRKKYRVKERNFTILAISLIALAFVLDATVCQFRPTYWAYDMVFLAIVLLLFRLPADRHLALVTWCICAANEFAGLSLGAWQHYDYAGQVSTLAGHVDITAPAATGFSFTGITPSYLLFLWGSIRFAEYVTERKKPLIREFALLACALGLKTYTWLSSSLLLAAIFG